MAYVYIEYGSIGRTLHKWPDLTCSVRNDEEKAAALADGWSLLPVKEPPATPVDPPVDATSDDVSVPVEADTPKRRGRKALRDL